MFTGIVEEVGRVVAVVDPSEGDGTSRLTIRCSTVLEDAFRGASIAVDGCCLTVEELEETDSGPAFAADLMAETLRVTTIGGLSPGDAVNLERPMSARGRFGGHIVQGHVDAVGAVVGRDEVAGTTLCTIELPSHLRGYVVAKGSIAVDGVSLTVVDVDDSAGVFRVALIPHTCAVTTLGDLRPGDEVNLEVDIVAKYVERALTSGTETPYA